MSKSPFSFDLPSIGRLHHVLETVLHGLSLYLVPLAIGLLSVIALLFWSDRYIAGDDQVLPFQVALQGEQELAPRAALERLVNAPVSTRHDTGLSQAPRWFRFSTDLRLAGPLAVEFPSRHAVEMACWDGASLQLLGRASRSASSGALAPLKSGFALEMARRPASLLCRATFVGPARLSVVQWPADQLAVSVQEFHRKSGLLDGGMIVLTLFVLTTALINRQPLYVLFAGWLILNLRVGALSAGWDIQWLGQVVPQSWLLPSRSLTIALYGIVTLTLYQTLFRDDLLGTRCKVPLRVAEWLCLPLLACAILLPYQAFLPVAWVITGLALPLMTLGLITVMIGSQTRVAFWFAASFSVTFLATLAEVVSAALGLRELVGLVNSVTAALASSLLAALAVAEQMRVETEQRIAAQAELQHTYEAMPVGLFTLDVLGNFLSANPALCKMLDVEQIVPGRTQWKQFFSEAIWTRLHEQVYRRADVELDIELHDGSRSFVVRATLARGRIEAVLQDTTEQNKATEQLRFMANNDPLTKVYNRRGIERLFEMALGPLSEGKPMALAYLDLDRFKLINDLFGHGAGDEVLKQVCERIAKTLASGQYIGRVGGDEFVILMPDTSIGLASLMCRGIVERIGNIAYHVGDQAFHVRGSIGLIEVSPGMQIKDAVSTADRACREAKDGHSSNLVVYERHASAFLEREAELALVARLSGQDATAGMFLEMQPIMSLKTPFESLNFEVLLRMHGADGKVMPAGPIIAAAEKSGRIGLIDRWVLTSTLAWIEEHSARLERTHFVCMNLSGASLNDERFVQDTIHILSRHGHVASRLCIEITESVALHDLKNTRRFIDQVRVFGVKVALDDFGAGYTSFSYLKELPADVLKIDGNFIVNMNAHPANVAIVEAIVNLAVNLGMKTIAEWAEDCATVRTLAEIGVDYVQGYAVARPMAPEKILAARSAAAFIDDKPLLLLAQTLGSAVALDPLHEARMARVNNLH